MSKSMFPTAYVYVVHVTMFPRVMGMANKKINFSNKVKPKSGETKYTSLIAIVMTAAGHYIGWLIIMPAHFRRLVAVGLR